jgi:uroporphyrinogen-III synthase
MVYRNTGPNEADAELVYNKLISGEIDVVTFASPSAAINFARLFPRGKMAMMDKRLRTAVIGPTTEEAVRNLGMKVDIVARQSTVESLTDAIQSYYEPQ